MTIKWFEIKSESDLRRSVKDGEYILIYVPNRPWYPRVKQKEVFVKSVEFCSGISQAERSVLPDTSERKREHHFGDEGYNNTKPWAFKSFGPGQYFGQEPTHYALINVPGIILC